jgi:hypothetical protein
MSGRWVEQQTPFTSLLDLCEAVDDLQGYSLMGQPNVLRDLRALESALATAATTLETALSSVDTATLNATLAALEGSDEVLSTFRASMDDSVASADRSLAALTTAVNAYEAAEQAYRSAMDRSLADRPATISISTPSGQRQLDLVHGRYRYREYVSDYNAATDMSWLQELGRGYERVHERRERSLKTVTTDRASDVQRVRLSLEQRVQKSRELAAAAEQEELRRSRDREVMSIAKKNGFKVSRKVVGKKVQYALVRQR